MRSEQITQREGNFSLIEKTDAIELLEKNLQRTEMLIEAMEKIKAYNGLYQMSNADACEHNKIVTIVQNQQLMYIQQSCGEHAIISLATAFEIYYKELVQQLFADYPGYFVSRNTKYSDKLNKLIQDHELATYEQIEFELKLRNRFDYYILFKAYSLPFLTLAEKRVVEYIYQQRNLYVHNAGRLYSKS